MGLPLLESFRFENEGDCKTFGFKFSHLFCKNRYPEKLHCTFFTTKVSMLISVKGTKALYRLVNDKIPNI